MKIVNRETFLSLPENTVYSYSGWQVNCPNTNIEGFFIKGATVVGVDYYEQAIPDFDWDNTDDRFESIRSAAEDGCELKIDLRTETRNGMFDKEQLYLVWDRDDIESLISRLKECL